MTAPIMPGRRRLSLLGIVTSTSNTRLPGSAAGAIAVTRPSKLPPAATTRSRRSPRLTAAVIPSGMPNRAFTALMSPSTKAMVPEPTSEPRSILRSRMTPLDGAVSASVLEKVDGLMQQVQYDLSIGHHLEADQLLRERLKASRIDLTDEQITALVDELAPVDYARHARERLEAEEEHQAAEAAGGGTR